MSKWIRAQLRDLVTFHKGKKVETSPYVLPGYHRYLGASSLSGSLGGYASTYLAVQASTHDILMLWDGERSGLVGHGLEGVVSSTVSKLTPNGKISSNYLYYFLLNSFEWIQNRRTGTGVPHVSKDLGRILLIDFPEEKSYQEKIALVLGTIDQTIKKTEELIKKYQQIKTGLMQDLFTCGIGSDGKLRPTREQAPELYYKTKIGWIPKDWEAISISKILISIDSGWSPSCLEITPTIGEWGVLKVSAVTKGYYDYSESKTLPSALKPIPSLVVCNGDVIMTRANGVAELVGKTVQVKNTQDKLMLSDKLLRLVPDSAHMTKNFLALLMSTNIIKSQIEKTMSGSSGQKNISQSEIRAFVIVKPKKSEQLLISERLLASEKLIEKEKKYLTKLGDQKLGLLNDLLTGKKSVTVSESEATSV